MNVNSFDPPFKIHLFKNILMRIRGLLAFYFIALHFYAPAQNLRESSTINRPKLVVGIVVDQMRWDYLYRYYDRFGHDGFKRLLTEGFTCENVFINYLPSYTAV